MKTFIINVLLFVVCATLAAAKGSAPSKRISYNWFDDYIYKSSHEENAVIGFECGASVERSYRILSRLYKKDKLTQEGLVVLMRSGLEIDPDYKVEKYLDRIHFYNTEALTLVCRAFLRRGEYARVDSLLEIYPAVVPFSNFKEMDMSLEKYLSQTPDNASVTVRKCSFSTSSRDLSITEFGGDLYVTSQKPDAGDDDDAMALRVFRVEGDSLIDAGERYDYLYSVGPFDASADENTIYMSFAPTQKWHEGQRDLAHLNVQLAIGKRADSGFFNSEIGHLGLTPKGYSATCPLVVDDELYFCSNMPGGFGGSDLYMVKLDDSGYPILPAVNLGATINTSGEEVTPQIDENGVFTFASTGHPGFGGYDLYQYVDGEVKNLGKKFNTHFDEIEYTVVNSHEGYFISNREDDIENVFMYTRD